MKKMGKLARGFGVHARVAETTLLALNALRRLFFFLSFLRCSCLSVMHFFVALRYIHLHGIRLRTNSSF